MTRRKTKEVDVHMVDNALERPRGITSAYATLAARCLVYLSIESSL